ncbi:hypothetical protein BDN70DRAFT_887969 [Pholiota conissans]|uniref:Uncharacterized protein n=1 Tax=Pholiota conissans TaxID=109636 RepID=A0A9P5YKM8_9AGAR|nr:hypothetical protein BDN70DRAFT_887969 [Pholiota conissans]
MGEIWQWREGFCAQFFTRPACASPDTPNYHTSDAHPPLTSSQVQAPLITNVYIQAPAMHPSTLPGSRIVYQPNPCGCIHRPTHPSISEPNTAPSSVTCSQSSVKQSWRYPVDIHLGLSCFFPAAPHPPLTTEPTPFGTSHLPPPTFPHYTPPCQVLAPQKLH